ncbi:MAG: 4-hydroxy-3-methylbut-2-enyl diphosphate reductase [Thermodesulfobacteriota bacterium]
MKEDIKIAETAGFCMGVRRAVEIALEQANLKKDEKPIKTFGPLIHNPQVLELLEEKNIKCIEEIPENGDGTVIIRAHGIPPQTKEKLKNAGFTILDATCPRVIKVQAIIKKHSARGYNVIIAGDHDHAEVVGLAGYAGQNGVVINSEEEFDKLPDFESAIVVAQTTQNTKFYEHLTNKIEKKFPHYKIFNTICDSTEKRQKEIKEIAKEVDAVVVVGGKTSGNTKRLKEVASQEGTKAFHIENEKELDIDFIADQKKIGITAGASTPNWVIAQVYKAVKTAQLKKDKNAIICLFIFLKFLFRFNIILASGAAALAFSASALLGLSSFGLLTAAVPFFYTLSIHTINNIALINSDKFNDPHKAQMYEKYKPFIFTYAVAAGILCLYFSYQLGIIPFFIILLMSAAGLCYKIPLIKLTIISKDFVALGTIPGSKAFLIAGAWSVICTLIPVFASSDFTLSQMPGIITVLIFCGSMAFFRTIWFDILAIHGNKIAGEITIPVLIGEEKASDILKYILIFVTILLIGGAYADIITKFGYLLTVYPILSLYFIMKNKKNEIQPGFFDDIITESLFLISAVLALVWIIFT